MFHINKIRQILGKHNSFPKKTLLFNVQKSYISEFPIEIIFVPVISTVLYLIKYYKVAAADEKIVVTGPFTKNEMDIKKTALILPFQKYKFISNQAHSISTHVSAMTKEKIPFDMPMYFTICTDDSSDQSLSLFAKKFGNLEQYEINKTIESVVHGEARLLTGGMEVEHIFNNREIFKNNITSKIQECLTPFGINVDNVNIGELNDSKGSDYFKNLRERALQKAQREANVATAEHTFNADSEKKEFEVESRKKICSSESQAVETENINQQHIVKSQTLLKILQANQAKDAELAKLEAEAISKKREIDLKKEIEEKRRDQMIEQQKADQLSKSIVDKDTLIVETEAKVTQIKMLAEVHLLKVKLEADAKFYEKQKEAEGELTFQTARAEGLKRNIEASGGTINDLQQYIMVEERQHVDIAKEFANSVKGMNPTILSNGNTGAISNVITDIGSSALVLSEVFKSKTGIDPVKLLKNKIEN